MARNDTLASTSASETEVADPYEKWFWTKIQEGLGSTIIPKYLKNALSIYGLSKGTILAGCTESHISSLQNFIRSPDYASCIPRGADARHYFGIYGKSPESFEFGFEGQTILTQMIEFAKTKKLDFWDPFQNNNPDVEAITSGLDLSEKTKSLIEVLVEVHKQNKDRDDRGNRFPMGIKMFSSFLKMTGGRLLYEILARNFHKSLPTCSTVDKFIRRVGEQIIEGKLRIPELKKFLTDRGLPFRIGLSEDACAIVEKIQYDSATDQGVGAVLPLNKHGMPIPGSYPATNVRQIQEIFKKRKSRLLHVVMAQPLAKGAPSFCLMMFGTDGAFSANEIVKRNYHTARLLEREGITVEYTAADADPKFLLAQRIMSGLSEKQYADNSCSITIDGETIFLPEYHAFILEHMIPNQDTVHIVTKLRNNLIKDSRVLPMGKRMASHTDLEDLIKFASKDKHKLTATDLRPYDKMNFKSVRKVFSPETIALLKKYIKRSEATQIYLLCTDFVMRSLLSEDINIEQRVYYMWHALYFIRLWRTWILNHDEYTVAKNFISPSTYMCIELNAHCLIQIVLSCIKRKDFEPLTWMIGSQTCESFFKVYRCDSTTQSMVVNCTVQEGTKKLRKTQMMQDILVYDFKKDGMNIEFPRNKFLHPTFETAGFRFSGDSGADLNNRTITLTLLRATLDAAKRDALAAALSLGMLNLTLSDADRCYVTEIPLKKIDIHVDDDADGSQSSSHVEANPGLILPSSEVTVDRSEEMEEIQEDVDFLSSIDDIQLVDYSEKEFAIRRSEKDYQFIKVRTPNGTEKLVRKSAIFWLLDQGRHRLSSDRLQRVQESSLDDASTIPETFLPAHSESHVCDAIRKGEWCMFKEITDEAVHEGSKKIDDPSSKRGQSKGHNRKNRGGKNRGSASKNKSKGNLVAPAVEPMRCLVGHVRSFAYMGCKTVGETQYSSVYANKKGNKKTIGVMCYWFTIDPDGSLREAEMHTHGFIDIKNYVRTIRPPTERDGQQYVSPSIVDQFGRICSAAEPRIEPMEID